MRKPSSGRPIQAPLQASLEEMRQGIDRLTKRLADVSAFEPTSVTQQNNIPHVEALAASVDDSLRRTFGADTLDYGNYSDAAFFDNGPFNYAFQVPISQVHASLSRSKARSIALLTQAIKSLEERLAECRDASSLESEFPPPRFSRRTVIAAVEVIEGRITHADLTRRLLKWNAELNTLCDAGSLPDRFNHLIKFFDERPHFRLDDGVMLADELVEHAVSMLGQSLAPSLKVDAFAAPSTSTAFPSWTVCFGGRCLPRLNCPRPQTRYLSYSRSMALP